jgi:hypothetical protein
VQNKRPGAGFGGTIIFGWGAIRQPEIGQGNAGPVWPLQNLACGFVTFDNGLAMVVVTGNNAAKIPSHEGVSLLAKKAQAKTR